MRRKCKYCKQEARFACSCSEPPVLLCGTHSHHTLPVNLHRQVEIYPISEESHILAKSICDSVAIELRKIERSHFEFISFLILQIKAISKNFHDKCRQTKLEIQSMAKYLSSYDYLLNKAEKSREERNLFSLIIEEKFELPEFPDHNEILESLIQSFKENSEHIGTRRGSTNQKVTKDIVEAGSSPVVVKNNNENIRNSGEAVKNSYENIRNSNEAVKNSYENKRNSNEVVKNSHEDKKNSYEEVKNNNENKRSNYEEVKNNREIVNESANNISTENKMLILPIPFTKSVFVFDIDKHNPEILRNLYSEDFPFGYGFTATPGDELMIYGGATKLKSDKTLMYEIYKKLLIINPITKSLRQIKSGILNLDTGNGTYFNGSVYVFGGRDKNNKELNVSARFNCANFSWTNIANLPSPMVDCSTAVFYTDILVYSKNSPVIYIYDISLNIYKQQFENKTGNKIVLCSKNGIFILCGKELLVFKNSRWEPYCYSNIEINSMMISPYIERRGFIYFMTGKVDYSKKSLTETKMLRLNLSSQIFEIVLDPVLSY